MIAAGIREIAAVLGTSLAPVFAQVNDWRLRLEAAFADGVGSAGELDEIVQWLVAAALAESGPTLGAGFVAAPGFLEETPWHMAWWLSAANGAGLAGRPGTLRRLEAVENPADEAFLDYTRLEWWRGAVKLRDAYLTGPYIDYLCTDELTLTLTVPVKVDGAIAGVVGADLSVARLERLTDGVLSRSSVPAVLGTSAGRVVAATDMALEPGMPASRYARVGGWHPVPGCGGTLSVARAS